AARDGRGHRGGLARDDLSLRRGRPRDRGGARPADPRPVPFPRVRRVRRGAVDQPRGDRRPRAPVPRRGPTCRAELGGRGDRRAGPALGGARGPPPGDRRADRGRDERRRDGPMTLAELTSWSKRTTATGVLLVPPGGTDAGMVRIDQQVRPIVRFRQVLADLMAAGHPGYTADVGPVT